MSTPVPVASSEPSRVLIGGVGYRWFGDASFGLVATDELAAMEWPAGVDVVDLGYGAILAAQDIAAAQPPYDRLILLAAVPRGRPAGRIYLGRWQGDRASSSELQERIREAAAGVIDLDHLLVIAAHFGALPDDVVTIELEPVDAGGGERLSGPAAELLPEVLEMVRREALSPGGGIAQRT